MVRVVVVDKGARQRVGALGCYSDGMWVALSKGVGEGGTKHWLTVGPSLKFFWQQQTARERARKGMGCKGQGNGW